MVFEKPIYPYLYGFSFIVYKSARYFPSFSAITALAFFLAICLFSYVFTTILKKIQVSSYNPIGTVVLMASVFHVSTIAQFVGYEYSNVPGRFYLVFYSIVLVLTVALEFFFVRLSDEFAGSFNKVANVFLVIFSTVFLINGVIYAEKTYGNYKERQTFGSKIPVNRQRDIVWFLLDEYPSGVSLKKQFNFDNPLTKQLSSQGFVVLDSMRTRFNSTLFSLNAIFNEDDSIAPANFYAGVRSLQRGSWVKELDSSGYEVVNLGFLDLGNYPKLADRSGYPQTYWQQLVSGTLVNVLINEVKYSIPRCDQYANQVLKQLDDTLSKPSSHHRFLWAHLPIPHEPFCRDSEGRLLGNTDYSRSADTNTVKKYFLSYLQYGNIVLSALFKKHPDLLQKIVIISGDHGPRYRFLKNKAFQNSPFAAVMIPESYDTLQLKRLRYISQLPAFVMHHLSN